MPETDNGAIVCILVPVSSGLPPVPTSPLPTPLTPHSQNLDSKILISESCPPYASRKHMNPNPYHYKEPSQAQRTQSPKSPLPTSNSLPKDSLTNPPLNKLESQREWKSSTKRKAEEDSRDNCLIFSFLFLSSSVYI